jgi:hypothetical protein
MLPRRDYALQAHNQWEHSCAFKTGETGQTLFLGGAMIFLTNKFCMKWVINLGIPFKVREVTLEEVKGMALVLDGFIKCRKEAMEALLGKRLELESISPAHAEDKFVVFQNMHRVQEGSARVSQAAMERKWLVIERA